MLFREYDSDEMLRREYNSNEMLRREYDSDEKQDKDDLNAISQQGILDSSTTSPQCLLKCKILSKDWANLPVCAFICLLNGIFTGIDVKDLVAVGTVDEQIFLIHCLAPKLLTIWPR